MLKLYKTAKTLILFLCVTMLCGHEANAQTALDNYITGQMNLQKIPGLSAAIIKDGKLAWTKGYGFANVEKQVPVTPNTIFMLASVSKPFAGAALMKLYEQGKFGLDDSVNTYLPFRVYHPKFADIPITFRHLLTHTSGIKDNWDVLLENYTEGDSPLPLGKFLEDYLAEIGMYYDADKHFTTAAPGTKWEYSNAASALVGYLVETISGIPFDVYSVDSLFTPLCLNYTSWKLSGLDAEQVALPYYYENGQFVNYGHYGYPDYPNGQLRSNVIDIARFMYMHTNNGKLGQNQILKESTIQQIFTPQIPSIDANQGIIWMKANSGGKTYWTHNGGDFGVRTVVAFEESSKTGVVILTNGEGNYNTILSRLLLVLDTIKTENAPAIDCNLNVSIVENKPEISFAVYPVPANYFLNVQLKDQLPNTIQINLLNINGAELKNINFLLNNYRTFTADVANISKGVYILRITCGTNVYHQKVIIK